MPVFAARAGGGIVVDVDGNHLIDLGSGIAVTTVGNSAPRVVAAVQRAGRGVHPHLLHGHALRGLRRASPRPSTGSRPATTTSAPRSSTPAPRRSRTPSRSPASHTGRDAVVVFDHAYHGRTNLTMAMTAKNMPYKHGFGPFASEVYRAPMSYPFRDGGSTGPRPRPRAPSTSSTSRSAPTNLAAVVIEPDPGRGRLHRARPPASCPRSPRGAAPTASSSSPTRCRPASPAPATCSRATTRASSPTSSSPPRASPAACRSRRVTGRAEMMDAAARRRPRRHLRRQPGRLRRRARRHRDDRGRRPGRPRPRDRGLVLTAAARAAGATTPASATCAAAAR